MYTPQLELINALEVLDAVDGHPYPPTNPSVLLNAARTIYLNQEKLPSIHAPSAIMRLLVWTLNVISQQYSGIQLEDRVREAIAVLEFSRDTFKEATIASTEPTGGTEAPSNSRH